MNWDWTHSFYCYMFSVLVAWLNYVMNGLCAQEDKINSQSSIFFKNNISNGLNVMWKSLLLERNQNRIITSNLCSSVELLFWFYSTFAAWFNLKPLIYPLYTTRPAPNCKNKVSDNCAGEESCSSSGYRGRYFSQELVGTKKKITTMGWCCTVSNKLATVARNWKLTL